MARLRRMARRLLTCQGMTPVDKKYGEDEVPPLPADDLRPEWEKENREIEDRKPTLSEIEEDTTDFD